jgi:hypothetical protein
MFAVSCSNLWLDRDELVVLFDFSSYDFLVVWSKLHMQVPIVFDKSHLFNIQITNRLCQFFSFVYLVIFSMADYVVCDFQVVL